MNIGNFLQKINTIIPLETRIRNVTIQAISEILGIALQRSKITVSRDVIIINGSSALKSEILLKQVKILTRIKELDPELSIKKIT